LRAIWLLHLDDAASPLAVSISAPGHTPADYHRFVNKCGWLPNPLCDIRPGGSPQLLDEFLRRYGDNKGIPLLLAIEPTCHHLIEHLNEGIVKTIHI
jgi:hypothetical protein